jgi:hypothetical protein
MGFNMFKDDVTCLARFPKRRLQSPRRADLPKLRRPEATAATEEAAGAEGGGGAARVDGDGGVPAVGDRNGEVDEDGDGAAKPEEATPRWEAVRGDDGGEPELGGDGGERERRRELDSGEETVRQGAETGEGGTGRV